VGLQIHVRIQTSFPLWPLSPLYLHGVYEGGGLLVRGLLRLPVSEVLPVTMKTSGLVPPAARKPSRAAIGRLRTRQGVNSASVDCVVQDGEGEWRTAPLGGSGALSRREQWLCSPLPAWMTLLINAAACLGVLAATWPVARSIAATQSRAVVEVGADPGLCTPAAAGSLYFDRAAKMFVACDGQFWSRLAFCCAPDRPAKPRLSLPTMAENDTSVPSDAQLRVAWVLPKPNGSPVANMTVWLRRTPYLRGQRLYTADDELFSTGEEICKTPGDVTHCYVRGLDARQFYWLRVIAHAPGGSSPPSEAASLLPAPAPKSFEADDDGDCVFTSNDSLRLVLDVPTNQPFADTQSRLGPEAVRRLLQLSDRAGEIMGYWETASTLVLKPRIGSRLSYLEITTTTIQKSASLRVTPPGISMPASGATPRLLVPGCWIDGFESGLYWQIESADVGAYSVLRDEQVKHSMRYSMRLAGGQGGQFDGVVTTIGNYATPRQISCWLRCTSKGNVGYLTLGGPSLQDSIFFFHLRDDGTAGVLGSTGYFKGGTYLVNRWLHVSISLDWEARMIDLDLDGVRVASLDFVSSALHAEQLHLFNVDEGTIWWDDFHVRLWQPPSAQKTRKL